MSPVLRKKKRAPGAGRPRLAEGEAKVQFTVWLKPIDIQRFQELAHWNNRSHGDQLKAMTDHGMTLTDI